MHRKILLISVALLMLLAVQCSDKSTTPEPKETPQLNLTDQQVATASNNFGLKLFREIVAQEPDTNIFISPLSVAMALSMTYNGARGETQAAMQEALSLQGLTVDEVNAACRNLIDFLCNVDPDVRMQIANSIWYRLGFTVLPEFLDVNQTYFDAEVEALDFRDPAAVGIINNWVNENTNGKIPSIVDDIPDYIVMFLINAVYFKGSWTESFNPDLTMEAPFLLPGGSSVSCQMMAQEGVYSYYRGDDFAILDLPYGNGDFNMTIFLPDSVNGVDAMLGQFTDENWEDWLASLQPENLDIMLPKFELEYALQLNNALSALGMGVAFAAGVADFSGIDGNDDLYIDKVKHKTYVKVDEEGTEAAGVTSVEVGLTSIMTPYFLANHPFVYVIREKTSGSILFIGKLIEPHI
jgi:serine protease inhibitor